MKTLVLAVAGLTVLASGLAAQQRPRGTAFADGAIVRYGTKLGGAVAGSFGGPTFGVQAGLSLAKFTLSAQYLEGRLQPRSGSPDTVSRDLVEARLLLGVRPVPWLSLGVGPHIRAFVFDTTTVRWVMWQARVRAQGALPSTSLETYVEFVPLTEVAEDWLPDVSGGAASSTSTLRTTALTSSWPKTCSARRGTSSSGSTRVDEED